MKIYFDLCSLQRPLDTKYQIRIAVEAEAVLSVISLVESEIIDLVSSEVLIFEISCNPNQTRKEFVLELLRKTTTFVELNEELEKRAKEFTSIEIKPLDALHLASAEEGKADYFCTCDDKFLKKAKSINNLKIKVVSPLELIIEIEK